MRRFVLGLVAVFMLATGIGVGLGASGVQATNGPICYERCDRFSGEILFCCRSGTQRPVCTHTGSYCGGE